MVMGVLALKTVLSICCEDSLFKSMFSVQGGGFRLRALKLSRFKRATYIYIYIYSRCLDRNAKMVVLDSF